MKKHEIYEGTVESLHFPNKAIVRVADEEMKAVVKNALPGQKISFRVEKKRGGRAEGRLMEILEKAPYELECPDCEHFEQCGGCSYQNLAYEEQLKLKEIQMVDLFTPVMSMYEEGWPALFGGVTPSPKQAAYRNKMEYTFGDEVKDGPMALGMHKQGSFYDIVTVRNCKIVDADMNMILDCVLAFFAESGVTFYHRMRHTGFLRHLLVRRGEKTGELLVDLVTTWAKDEHVVDYAEAERNLVEATDLVEKWKAQARYREAKSLMEAPVNAERPSVAERDEMLTELTKRLLELPLNGEIVGILNTKNDNVADAIINEETKLLYGRDYFYEEILGLKFKISPFSFFQTNSLGAEVLYETARDFIRESVGGDLSTLQNKVVFDLYSGTGTIAQMMASVAGKVVGVEIIEEAVEAAKENAELNKLSNCEFIAGDVLKVLDDLTDKPDYIILDPPRDGIHPKALEKIIAYGVEKLVYISCKPTSLVRDLEIFHARGYRVEKMQCVDMFPGTVHVETVVLLSQGKTETLL